MNMTAADVMIRDVVVVTEATPLREVARLFADHRISGVPVVDQAGSLVGVISESDIVRRANSIGGWSPTIVGQIMTRPAVTVPPGEPLSRVCQLMSGRRIHRIVVVEDERILGILTSMEILGAVASHFGAVSAVETGGSDAGGGQQQAWSAATKPTS